MWISVPACWAFVTYLIAYGSSNKMVPSNMSPTNWGLVTDQWKLLFELVGSRSVIEPKPFSNQLLQLQRSRREVIDKSLTTFKLKSNENSSANLMHFYRWQLGESLQSMCDWGFNDLLNTMQSNEYCASFYDLFGQDFANLYAFQYQAHEKKSPVLISTRELTFHHTGVWRSYVIRSFKRLYLH